MSWSPMSVPSLKEHSNGGGWELCLKAVQNTICAPDKPAPEILIPQNQDTEWVEWDSERHTEV